MEWNEENNAMKARIDNLQKQIEENKRFQENLIIALQSKSPQVANQQRKMMRGIKGLNGRLKNMQNIVNSSSALQCRYCGETISSKLFNSNITVCAKKYEECTLKEQPITFY